MFIPHSFNASWKDNERSLTIYLTTNHGECSSTCSTLRFTLCETSARLRGCDGRSPGPGRNVSGDSSSSSRNGEWIRSLRAPEDSMRGCSPRLSNDKRRSSGRFPPAPRTVSSRTIHHRVHADIVSCGQGGVLVEPGARYTPPPKIQSEGGH